MDDGPCVASGSGLRWTSTSTWVSCRGLSSRISLSATYGPYGNSLPCRAESRSQSGVTIAFDFYRWCREIGRPARRGVDCNTHSEFPGYMTLQPPAHTNSGDDDVGFFGRRVVLEREARVCVDEREELRGLFRFEFGLDDMDFSFAL